MTVALLPLRSLRDGKRRLQTAYSSEERTLLVQEMLRRVVGALAGSSVIARIVVVSPDQELIAWVARFRVDILPQPGLGLNEGLEYARQTIRHRWPHAPIMVMLPDLPLVSSADIDAMTRLGAQNTVVVAPDRHSVGTNAMWLPASATLPFVFGKGSLRQHQEAATLLGLTMQCYRSAGTALDIDTTDDIELAGHSLELTRMSP